jgi:hypothetical protein
MPKSPDEYKLLNKQTWEDKLVSSAEEFQMIYVDSAHQGKENNPSPLGLGSALWSSHSFQKVLHGKGGKETGSENPEGHCTAIQLKLSST